MNIKVLIICLLSIVCLTVSAQELTDRYYTVDNFSEEDIVSYFDRTSQLDSIEGIWESNQGFRVSISRFQDEAQPKKIRYRMVVINNFSDDDFWQLGYVKAFITADKKKKGYKISYLVMDRNKLWHYDAKLKEVSGIITLNKPGLYEIYEKVYPVVAESKAKGDSIKVKDNLSPVPRLTP